VTIGIRSPVTLTDEQRELLELVVDHTLTSETLLSVAELVVRLRWDAARVRRVGDELVALGLLGSTRGTRR
jgi:hypothetical protein